MDCTASRQAAAPEILQATAAAMSRLVERGPGGDPHAYICALATALGALAPTSRATLPLISALRGIGTAGLATALQRAVAAVWSLMDAAANRETRALTAALQGRLLSLLAALCERDACAAASAARNVATLRAAVCSLGAQAHVACSTLAAGDFQTAAAQLHDTVLGPLHFLGSLLQHPAAAVHVQAASSPTHLTQLSVACLNLAANLKDTTDIDGATVQLPATAAFCVLEYARKRGGALAAAVDAAELFGDSDSE